MAYTKPSQGLPRSAFLTVFTGHCSVHLKDSLAPMCNPPVLSARDPAGMEGELVGAGPIWVCLGALARTGICKR